MVNEDLPLTSQDYLSPQETVDFIREKAEQSGKNDFIQKARPEDRKEINKQLNPYMEIPLTVNHAEDKGVQAYLYILNKPFGIEFRTPESNIKASSPGDLKKKLSEYVPGNVDLDITFNSKGGDVVVNVPYKESMKSQIGLFINPGTIQVLRDQGAGDVGGYFTVQDTIDEAAQKVLQNPDLYEVNEMREGSLTHKTREKVNPGEWRSPPWHDETT